MNFSDFFTPPAHFDSITNALAQKFSDFPNLLAGQTGRPATATWGSDKLVMSIDVQGTPFFQTCDIKIAVATKDGRPCDCGWKWSRQLRGSKSVILGANESTYRVSADDIGCEIIAKATHNLSGEVVVGRAGPFSLDPSTASALSSTVSSGASRFPVRYFEANSSQPSDLLVQVKQDQVIVQQHSAAGMKEKGTKYSGDFPRVLLHPSDPVKFKLQLGESRIFHLEALSRTSRDLIVLAIRAFHVRRHIECTILLRSAAVGVSTDDFPFASSQSAAARNLQLATAELSAVEEQMVKYKAEKSSVEAQLEETIQSYTQVINNLQAHLAGSAESSGDLRRRLQASQQDSLQLQSEIAHVRSQIAAEENPDEMDLDGPGLPRLCGESTDARAVLREQNEMCIAKLRQLEHRIAEAQQQPQPATPAEQAAVARITADLENLRQSIRAARGALDATSRSISLPDDLSKARRERDLMAQRANELSRELEKNKGSQEGTMQRLMAANARLLEDKERLDAEVKQISTLYESTVSQLAASRHGVGAAQHQPGPSASEVSGLSAQLAARQATLSRLQQEQAVMKTRARELAAVT